jgi:hypothetical protein
MPLPDIDTPAHAAVLALLDQLPADADVDAELVAAVLAWPVRTALRVLEELEAAGDLTSAVGPRQ